jgi:hypothetical protein
MDNDDREEPEPRDVLVDNLNIRIQKLDAECNKLLKIANSRGHTIREYEQIVPKLKNENQALQSTIANNEKYRDVNATLETKLREVEETKAAEIATLQAKNNELQWKITELKDILDEETAKINLYNDLKKMVPELKRCLLANSTNQDTKELSEKPSSSAMIQEQKESNPKAPKSALEHTESNLIPESIIPDSKENAIELDKVRATKEQIKPENKSAEQINTPDTIKSKSKTRSKAKTAPEKSTDPEGTKSSLKSKPFKITDRIGRILKFLKTNPGSYNADISKSVNISTGDVSKLLKALTAEGLTTRNEDGQYDLGKQ